jgi:hypothetical protein
MPDKSKRVQVALNGKGNILSTSRASQNGASGSLGGTVL